MARRITRQRGSRLRAGPLAGFIRMVRPVRPKLDIVQGIGGKG